MKKLVLSLVIAAAAWGGHQHFNGQADAAPATAMAASTRAAPAAAPAPTTATPRFTCDGRQHCSQMRSCEEATYFVRHCPNTKMDGDGDGVPCESQWCG